jgi:hypothetical protein
MGVIRVQISGITDLAKPELVAVGVLPVGAALQFRDRVKKATGSTPGESSPDSETLSLPGLLVPRDGVTLVGTTNYARFEYTFDSPTETGPFEHHHAGEWAVRLVQGRLSQVDAEKLVAEMAARARFVGTYESEDILLGGWTLLVVTLCTPM